MEESLKTLMLCLNLFGCPKDIKSLIKNKIVEKIVRINENGYKLEWLELFGKKHGLYREWFHNGKMRFQTMYKDGKKTGLCRMWSADGQLCFECMYNDGKKNGPERWWHNGQLCFECMYKDGKKNGTEREWYNGQLCFEYIHEDR